jgi:hypothetical protein
MVSTTCSTVIAGDFASGSEDSRSVAHAEYVEPSMARRMFIGT